MANFTLKIIDLNSNAITGANIKLEGSDLTVLTGTTNIGGVVEFTVTDAIQYTLTASKTGYRTYRHKFTKSSSQSVINWEQTLNQIVPVMIDFNNGISLVGLRPEEPTNRSYV